MPKGFREFLGSRNGRIAAIALVVIGIGAAGYSIYGSLGSPAISMTDSRMYIDPKTGEAFRVKTGPGIELPPKAPSGATAFEAESCYWTKDGKAKEEPTYVLLNSHVGKPEPTFCPDCGRLVRGHNPPPITGRKPPPTKDEYDQRRDSRQERR
jgi:hypothetical protein